MTVTLHMTVQPSVLLPRINCADIHVIIVDNRLNLPAVGRDTWPITRVAAGLLFASIQIDPNIALAQFRHVLEVLAVVAIHSKSLFSSAFAPSDNN